MAMARGVHPKMRLSYTAILAITQLWVTGTTRGGCAWACSEAEIGGSTSMATAPGTRRTISSLPMAILATFPLSALGTIRENRESEYSGTATGGSICMETTSGVVARTL